MGILPSPVPCFRIGDRVQLGTPIAGIAAGAIGTVVNRFSGVPLYDVQFDGQTVLRVVEERKLVLARKATSRRR